jgi:hypothetical protein
MHQELRLVVSAQSTLHQMQGTLQLENRKVETKLAPNHREGTAGNIH